jgi:hypothetical protein
LLPVVFAAVGVTTGAAASPEPAPPLDHIALVYAAPAECPQGDAFRSAVRERASGDWEAQPGELARRIDVSVKRSGERYVAAIVFLNAAGERISRSLSGQSCEDVVNGIALVTALAIQSRVEEALAQSEPEPPKPPAKSAVPVPAPSATLPAQPPAHPPPVRETFVRLGAAARAASGTGPGPSFGPMLFGVLEWRRTRLGLAVSGLWSPRVTQGGVSAHYRRLSARLDGCPYAIGRGTLTFEPCAFFEAGSLHGEGDPGASLASTNGGGSPWLVPGVLLRLLARFEPVVVTLELGGGAPLVRERFGFVSGGVEHTTFHVPAFVLDGALGAGVRW